MKGVIDSKKGEYFRCLLENGDVLTIHSSEIKAEVNIGDIVELNVSLEKTSNS